MINLIAAFVWISLAVAFQNEHAVLAIFILCSVVETCTMQMLRAIREQRIPEADHGN